MISDGDGDGCVSICVLVSLLILDSLFFDIIEDANCVILSKSDDLFLEEDLEVLVDLDWFVFLLDLDFEFVFGFGFDEIFVTISSTSNVSGGVIMEFKYVNSGGIGFFNNILSYKNMYKYYTSSLSFPAFSSLIFDLK